MPPPERYNSGYNIGVGGAVVQDGRLLLVRRASRRGRGNWQVPGGFIEPDETIEHAVVREVAEEASVQARVEGILGVRNRCDPDVGNSLYIVLLLTPVGGATPGRGRLLRSASRSSRWKKKGAAPFSRQRPQRRSSRRPTRRGPRSRPRGPRRPTPPCLRPPQAQTSSRTNRRPWSIAATR